MTIQSIIDKIEKKNDVEVLVLNELGSRAYNIHSSDSDHDIYFVYKQPIEEYVMIDGYKENINEDEIIDNWDAQGWNIKKFADLIYNSNPTALEFISSPITHYYKNENIKNNFEILRNYSINNANPIGLYYHYISLSKRMYNKYLIEDWNINKEEISNSNISLKDIKPELKEDKDGLKLCLGTYGEYTIEEAHNKNFVTKTTTKRTVKKNLFAIRGICCAKWVKNNKSIPPIKFNKLLEKQEFLSQEEKKEIYNLISKKRNGNNEIVGKILPKFIDAELKLQIDNSEYNTGKLNKQKINNFISECI